jgi:uncharacterized protein YkwD
MRKKLFSKLGTAVCILALGSCASGPENQNAVVVPAGRSDTSLAGQVLQEVNSYRRQRGAADLQSHPGLNRLAQQHCEFLLKNRGKFGIYGKNVSHFGFEGRFLAARESYKMMNYCENVAAAKQPGKFAAPTLVKLWAGSKDHEFNMRSAWTYTGIGVTVAPDGMVFATQVFATANNSQLTTRQRFSGF